MELNQVHRTSCVGLTENVKSSTDYRMRFVHEQENNKPEKGSLIHLATNFQKQVQIEDVTHQSETATDTAPLIAKKDKRKMQDEISTDIHRQLGERQKSREI